MELDLERLPRHVAIIMDGNGRWARQKLRSRIFGHKKGADAVRSTVTCCRELGIGYLTLYAFSKENWNRPQREVKALWSLLEKYLKSQLPNLSNNRYGSGISATMTASPFLLWSNFASLRIRPPALTN